MCFLKDFDMSSCLIDKFLSALDEGGGSPLQLDDMEKYYSQLKGNSSQKLTQQIEDFLKNSLNILYPNNLDIKVIGFGKTGVIFGISYDGSNKAVMKLSKNLIHEGHSLAYEKNWNKKNGLGLTLDAYNFSNSNNSDIKCDQALFMKWHEEGTLLDYLKNPSHSIYQKTKAISLFFEKLPEEHNDLKPDNCFVKIDPNGNGNVKDLIYFDPFKLKFKKPLDSKGNDQVGEPSILDKYKCSLGIMLDNISSCFTENTLPMLSKDFDVLEDQSTNILSKPPYWFLLKDIHSKTGEAFFHSYMKIPKSIDESNIVQYKQNILMILKSSLKNCFDLKVKDKNLSDEELIANLKLRMSVLYILLYDFKNKINDLSENQNISELLIVGTNKLEDLKYLIRKNIQKRLL